LGRHGIPAVVSTDDGSYGFRGLVTQALEQYLDDRRVQGSGFRVQGSAARVQTSASSVEPGSADGGAQAKGFRVQEAALSPVVIYTCGPEPMMKRVAQIGAARGLECQVAVERAMACGMGTCQSCCIRVRK